MNSIRIHFNLCFGTLPIAAALFAFSAPSSSAQSTWSGLGPDAALGTASNWVGNVAPTFSGAESGTTTTALIFSNAVNTSVNIGNGTRRGVKDITFTGSGVGAFAFTNTGRWIFAPSGQTVVDSAVTNAIDLGSTGIGSNSVSGSYTFRNDSATRAAVLNLNNFLVYSTNGNAYSLILDGSNAGTNSLVNSVSVGQRTNALGNSGPVSVVKTGSGTWALDSYTSTGYVLYSGGVTLSNGTLALASSAALGSGTLTIYGGAIGSIISQRTVTNNIVVSGDFGLGVTTLTNGQATTFNGNIDLGGQTRTVSMLANSTTFGGAISNGGLTINSFDTTRQIRITNAVTYSGPTTVQGGVLVLSNTGALSANTVVDLSAATTNATLDISGLSGAGTTIGSLSGSNNSSISLGSKSLAVGGDNSSTALRAAIAGTGGSLIKNGSGTLTLGNSGSSYTGGTSLNGGAIAIASDNAFGTGTLTIADGTRIGSYATQARTISNNLTVSGNFTVGGFNNSTTFNGAMDLGASTRTITLDNSATVGGTVSGLGGLIVTSTTNRVLTLGGNNTYSGATTVSGSSILRVNGTLASSSVTVDAGATLGGSGVISNATTINGIHSPGNSPGLQTFGSDLTYNNGSSVTWELAANTTSGRGTSYDGINVGGILDFNGTVTLNLVFNTAGSAVNWSDTLWTSNQSWTLYSVTGSITDLSSFQIVVANWADSAAQNFDTVLSGASFNLTQSGQDILLNYQAVPEPSTYALLGMAAAAFAGYTIRRRKRAGN